MKAKLVGGKIELDILELLDALTDEERQQVVEHLSCFEQIIEHVGAQIIDGWTENGFWGAKGCGPTPFTALDKMRRRRSEEHTSELQSQFHLVCRLLLEKKKTK